MPNITVNRLEVHGKPRHILGFARAASGETVLDFNRLHPIPPEILNGDGMVCWDWRNANWGQKWNADLPLGYRKPENFTDVELIQLFHGGLFFRTAWGPPDALFDKVAKDFPELSFVLWHSQEEPICGVMRWKRGVRTRHVWYEAPQFGYYRLRRRLRNGSEGFVYLTYGLPTR